MNKGNFKEEKYGDVSGAYRESAAGYARPRSG